MAWDAENNNGSPTEPSLSTLQSSISSSPLEPPENHKRKEGLTNEPSSSSTPESPTLPIISTSTGAINYTMGELEGRLLKRLQAIESHLTQIGVQELPNRQRELEIKMNRLLQTNDLPSFGNDSSSKSSTSLELRFAKMEINHENLVTENKKLQARVVALEESRTPIKVSQIIDRLDNVIQVVNTHATESYHLEQSVQDIQQELISLRQTVDSWNDDQEANGEEQQEIPPQDDVPDLPLQDDQGLPQDTPPGLVHSTSVAGSATTVIVSSLELHLFKGSKRVFVRDAHLFVIGKHVVIDRWLNHHGLCHRLLGEDQFL